MNALLEARLKAVYPTGKDWEPDERQISINISNNAKRLHQAFSSICTTLPLRVVPALKNLMFEEFAVTSVNVPEFDTWVFAMDNAAKIRWIAERKTSYAALMIKVSRIADYFIADFNYWRPRGDTGYLDVDHQEAPKVVCHIYAEVVFRILQAHGFTQAGKEITGEKVPFVLTWGGSAIPEDDPRWNDRYFMPPPIPAVVYDCLFGDQ
jgi:hypothetical protein